MNKIIYHSATAKEDNVAEVINNNITLFNCENQSVEYEISKTKEGFLINFEINCFENVSDMDEYKIIETAMFKIKGDKLEAFDNYFKSNEANNKLAINKKVERHTVISNDENNVYAFYDILVKTKTKGKTLTK